jgi:hypothetical protein
MAPSPLPTPPPQVPLMDAGGKPTQQGFEFLDRLQAMVKQLNAVTNIFNGLTATQATALLDVFTSAVKGLAPASGGGTTNFLRADVSWAAPPLGGMTHVGSVVTTSGATASITGIPVCKMLMASFRNTSHDSVSSQTLRFALGTNNGSTYNTPQSIFTTALANTAINSGILTIINIDQTSNFVWTSIYDAQFLSGDEAVTSGTVNAIQFSWSGGNFDSGQIDVYASF